MKGVPLVNSGYSKGVLFLSKMEKERVRGFGHLGGASPFKTLLGTPRGSLLFLIHKLTLKPLSTVKDYTASLTGKTVREKTLLSFLHKINNFWMRPRID